MIIKGFILPGMHLINVKMKLALPKQKCVNVFLFFFSLFFNAGWLLLRNQPCQARNGCVYTAND